MFSPPPLLHRNRPPDRPNPRRRHSKQTSRLRSYPPQPNPHLDIRKRLSGPEINPSTPLPVAEIHRPPENPPPPLPIRQRNLKQETTNRKTGSLILGPAAHRDPKLLNLGLEKALEFFYWVENRFGFRHDEWTCREVAIVLTKGNRMNLLWDFLKNMSRRRHDLVTTSTMTCLVKTLGDQGLANEALSRV
ncbi:pentatricopeptide repeat (PPR) superfamily protein [Striga asiatica]|uniref:Pentatricopeptide repeat (PPR) superfamily protein n=1 Tax=Striga asiatica TaxID=4170 RepID=A0A5A7Q777_STRAF|nr:pentatricopeptide repeat (PPR) superfamily protein [Striga asiatica]